MTSMPRRTLLSLAAVGGAALATGVAAPARAAQAGDDWYAPMRDAIAGLPEPTATAAQVRVARPGQVWDGRAGVADTTTGAPVPPGARFRIGSVTKTFTATVVLQLAAERRLHLDAPLSRYLPGFLPYAYAHVTVRHLLDHRTGLPSPTWPDDIEWQLAHRFDHHTPEQLVRLALRNECEFEPGTRQHYTNMGYIVAAVLIHRVTGRSYAAEIEHRILRPLGLRDTSLPGDDPSIHGPHARGYQVLPDGTLFDVTRWNQSATPASGDMISSVRDLDTFMMALFGGRLLPAAQQQELFTVPAVPDLATGAPATYSAGLTKLVTFPNGQVIWGKSGARYGYSAAIAGTADAASRVVYSVNSTDAKSQTQTPVIERITLTALTLL
ncbi:serine hydrolase domain-containing protein [Catellatospora tritici]|uniref:serine hydrolase domain-containing protein n=1 Tax=Catellatospora tritici TaxID=2851566 RepID=UPI001C2D3072|nr:serine hydrolase domain-containing protein [Catellatospora tritici]MBV1856204.1 beta-lactamase family protein [Catellatospora tritici]